MTERVDAHLHVWRLGEGRYRWLGPRHGRLFRTFGAAEAREALTAAGVGRAILVQADDTAEDTANMLAQAAAHDWIAGVVGWLPLENPAAAATLLERWRAHHAFAGVRTLVHDDPRDDLLFRPEVRRTLAHIADAGLPFDVPDAWPRHLHRLPSLAGALPELTLVVDHLGKPPRADGRAAMDEWARQLRAVAEHPNTVAKVSGLFAPGAPFTAAALRPAWEIALDAFGPDRLMYGGDWPVSLLGAPYADTHAILAALIDELAPAEAEAVWAGTARRVYARALR
ncbi:amidohydrolase family protein [Specibacter cremeus]|uniref:amidohydrolase family protein n=1 Tax=Specibacter cremeus TaxID=1629051 RepID=UPI000F7AF63C|nr:amidohydrolase family protein [Specibacter cremeus]